MPFNKLALIALTALVFAIFFLGLVISQKGKPNLKALKPVAALEAFDGKLSIQSIDDLRVGGRKIYLCGVAFTKPQSLRAMVTEAARRDYQGVALRCKPVGTGTPCDGNVASKLGDAVVVQCLTPAGVDLADRLTQEGLLCGQPTQAGKMYRPC